MADGFVIEQTESIDQFEEQLLQHAKEELQRSSHSQGKWNKLLQMYLRQKAILEKFPFPNWLDEERDNLEDGDSLIPSIKHITRNIPPRYESFFRWGFKVRGTPNNRIIYTVEDYWKVILLYHFDKKYNGVIKTGDIKKAIDWYEDYLIKY